jgi:hypothetical protein
MDTDRRCPAGGGPRVLVPDPMNIEVPPVAVSFAAAYARIP